MKVNPEERSALKWADYFKTYWPMLRDFLIKTLLMRFMPRVISGPWGWIVTTAAKWTVDYVVKPLYNFTVRKIIVYFKKRKNHEAGENVQNSTTESDFNQSTDELP